MYVFVNECLDLCWITKNNLIQIIDVSIHQYDGVVDRQTSCGSSDPTEVLLDVFKL